MSEFRGRNKVTPRWPRTTRESGGKMTHKTILQQIERERQIPLWSKGFSRQEDFNALWKGGQKCQRFRSSQEVTNHSWEEDLDSLTRDWNQEVECWKVRQAETIADEPF